MNTIQQLNWRYATKQFDSAKKISPEDLETIKQSLALTPSSFGLQPWKFIIIESDQLKSELLPHSWGQAQVTDCSHLIVLCAKEETSLGDIDRFLDSIVTTRGGNKEDLEQYKNLMLGFIKRMDSEAQFNWAKNQVYIALGQLMSTVASMQIDACPMEGIIPQEYDKLLKLSGYKTVVACPIGYRSEEDKYASAEKVRYPLDELIEQR